MNGSIGKIEARIGRQKSDKWTDGDSFPGAFGLMAGWRGSGSTLSIPRSRGYAGNTATGRFCISGSSERRRSNWGKRRKRSPPGPQNSHRRRGLAAQLRVDSLVTSRLRPAVSPKERDRGFPMGRSAALRSQCEKGREWTLCAPESACIDTMVNEGSYEFMSLISSSAPRLALAK